MKTRTTIFNEQSYKTSVLNKYNYRKRDHCNNASLRHNIKKNIIKIRTFDEKAIKKTFMKFNIVNINHSK